MGCRWVSALVAALVFVLTGCGGSSKPAPRPTPRATPAPKTDAASIARRAKIPVLCYHQVRKRTAADSAQDRAYIVSPSAFAAQMKTLDTAGYTTITGDALADHLARGAKLPRKPILLTFDDGSEGHYTRVLPVLREHHFVATFFVMTVVLGKPGWLTRGQVRALDKAGMTIAGHTYDHKEVPGYAGEDWNTQLVKPGRELRRLVGHRIRLFAYPNGAYSADAIQHLWSAGYRVAFQLAEKLDRRHPLWSIRRIIVPQVSGKDLLREIRQDF
jgi:peptidoglycan/xylan/chitin deacetylase (PgdA/CDA1 family)